MRVQCPCCEYFTFGSEEEAFFEICEVCFWQYDEVAHDTPEISRGANHISLKLAKENYKKYGVCKIEHKRLVREPVDEEFPENNL